MSGRTFTRYMVTCDGCGETFGENGEFANEIVCKAAAYNAGWRFPNQILANGKQAARTNDACPVCAPEWSPRAAPTHWRNGRGAS